MVLPAYIEVREGSVEASDVINGDVAAVRDPSSYDYLGPVIDSTSTTGNRINY